jgi:2-polyprenyl-6-hydroxyphenyl methylase/3-demethylubiquinone-9 3-methyltransferase
VLDVAAGTGNVAIRAAEAGAKVVASDLTPENFEAGRREARAHGVELDWVEADAEALPFGDGEFDVVTSAVGAIFAPHHQTVADELLRVCRPGGTIGMITLVPSGIALDLLGIIERYSPVLASISPLKWGSEEHVRQMFGDRLESLEMRCEPFALDRFEDPAEFLDFFKANHPLVVSVYRELADEPARVAALDHDLLEVATRAKHSDIEGLHGYDSEFLVVVARKRD